MNVKLSEAERLFLEATFFAYTHNNYDRVWESVINLFEKLPESSTQRMATKFVRDYIRLSAGKNWLELLLCRVNSALLLKMFDAIKSTELQRGLVLEEARQGNAWFVEEVAKRMNKRQRLPAEAFTLLADNYCEGATYSESMERDILRVTKNHGLNILSEKLAERFRKRTREARSHAD